jgi:hypothetical protein
MLVPSSLPISSVPQKRKHVSSEDLPGLRIDLFELELMGCNRLSCFIEDQEPGAGGSLVNGTNEGFLYAAHFEIIKLFLVLGLG